MSGGDRDAEAQPKKGEEETVNERSTKAAEALQQHWCVTLRVVELIISIIAVGLIVDAVNSRHIIPNLHHVAIIYSAYSSFIIITSVLILARVLGETPGWRTSLGFSVIGVIVFTAAAVVIFYDWNRSYYVQARPHKQNYDMMIASGIFAIFNIFVFLFHAFFTFRKEADY